MVEGGIEYKKLILFLIPVPIIFLLIFNTSLFITRESSNIMTGAGSAILFLFFSIIILPIICLAVPIILTLRFIKNRKTTHIIIVVIAGLFLVISTFIVNIFLMGAIGDARKSADIITKFDIAKEALIKNDVNICGSNVLMRYDIHKYNNINYHECVGRIAADRLDKDICLCKNLKRGFKSCFPEEEPAQECLTQMAISRNDVTICKQFGYEDKGEVKRKRNYCISQFAYYNQDLEMCETIDADEVHRKKTCIEDIKRIENKEEAIKKCKTQLGMNKDFCLASKAYLYRDNSLCNAISNKYSEIKELCNWRTKIFDN